MDDVMCHSGMVRQFLEDGFEDLTAPALIGKGLIGFGAVMESVSAWKMAASFVAGVSGLHFAHFLFECPECAAASLPSSA